MTERAVGTLTAEQQQLRDKLVANVLLLEDEKHRYEAKWRDAREQLRDFDRAYLDIAR